MESGAVKRMSERLQGTVKWWLLIGGAIAAIAMAWARLEAQIQQVREQKADLREVIELRAEVQAMRAEQREGFRIQRIILCDNARVKSDTYCR